MYAIRKSVNLDMAHNVAGHRGPCLSIHGHTWRFEVELESDTLTSEGFVCDFTDLKKRVLDPVHALLDHSYATSDTLLADNAFADGVAMIGSAMSRTLATQGCGCGRWLFRVPAFTSPERTLEGAYDMDLNGMKLVVFPFAPTSERLAEWLYHVASVIADERLRVRCARVYENLHPVEAVATYTP